ncbi:putative universal stress protein UspA [Desulforapulum autotrophicum HRM2]|uniref:Universal stress protein UspA n=1 Tax=Desulforapulum autotrophicum (strain ATCC 43914 / DSM 3382 / VKM B-1955 / HRM2) TaxID=177437 RepID=C0QL51_DESAH|nr:universal stress protein [Desulforapulum autotrophicum]ACN14137.1 putative universal stress protein UspA [Desulforapulum autotrophicum HRM2]
MNRHFLIAVSEEKSCLFGVRFVANFFSEMQHINATFFYSAPKPPAVWDNERSLEADLLQKEQGQKIMAKGKKGLENAIKECVSLGCLKDNLQIKLQSRVFSTAADIIREGERGKYDAVVLGRRGLSMLEEAFDDSVSRAVFDQKLSFPVWLCRASHPQRKNVLLYLDGSESCLRMADHVGFILSHENRHRLDILTCEKSSDITRAVEKCKSMLLDYGFPADLVRHKSVITDNVAGAILDGVNDEQYAAVALGRSGTKRNLLQRLFKGPVCSILFKELNETALWICH